MDQENAELFKPVNETPVVDIEKDKQDILKDLGQELVNKKQELADLDSKLGYMSTEELTAKKSQLNDEIIGIESRKSTLGQEAALPQTEIRVEQPIKPEASIDDFKTTIETDPDFLKKKFEEQQIDLGPAEAEQTKTVKERFNELREKTADDLDAIGKELNAKIVDVKAQAQIEQPTEQPTDQFETPDQLEQEAKQNEEQIKKIITETTPAESKIVEEPKLEKKPALSEIFSNPEAEKRMREIQAELDQEKDEIQALEEVIVEKKQRVKSLESEKDKLEQEGLVAFFRNVRNFEAANRRGAAGATRGGMAGELRAALEKYKKIENGKIQDQSFMEKVVGRLSIKMRKVFYGLYPDLAPKKEKLEKIKKPAKVKKAKSAIRGRGLVGNEGVSIA